MYETSTGVLKGTCGYMAPEQLLMQQDMDRRADVFAFGVMMYEAITGTHPCTVKSPAELYDRILDARYVKPRNLKHDISPRLEPLIVECMSKEPSDRPQTMRAVSAALRDVLLKHKQLPLMSESGDLVRQMFRRAAVELADEDNWDLKTDRFPSGAVAHSSQASPRSRSWRWQPHRHAQSAYVDDTDCGSASSENLRLIGAVNVHVAGDVTPWPETTFQADSDDRTSNWFYVDHPLIDGHSDARLLITPVAGSQTTFFQSALDVAVGRGCAFRSRDRRHRHRRGGGWMHGAGHRRRAARRTRVRRNPRSHRRGRCTG